MEQENKQSQEKKKDNKPVIIGLLVVILLLLLFIGGCWVLGRDGEPANTNTTATTTNTTVATTNATTNTNANVVEEDPCVIEREEWVEKLGMQDCRGLDPDDYCSGIYEYELSSTESIVLAMCYQGGTSNNYWAFHVNEATDEATRLEFDMYQVSGGLQVEQYQADQFASITDYSNFSSIGPTFSINDRFNGKETCGVDARQEWNDTTKEYELGYHRANLFCDDELQPQAWPVQYGNQ